MSETTPQQRPVRKLIVKNFSVIKDAELEFGKITVLIGPQASGKSLLCKLAYFFDKSIPEIIDRSFADRLILSFLQIKIEKEFLDKFPAESWRDQEFEVSFETVGFSVTIRKIADTDTPYVRFEQEFYDYYTENIAGPRVIVPSRIQLQRGELSGAIPIVDDSIYVPTGRTYFSVPNRGYAALATKHLDWVTQQYATEYEAEYKALLKCYESQLKTHHEFGQLAIEILNGKVIREEGRLFFESNNDSQRRPFEILSSGTLELLPLINSLSQLVDQMKFPDIPTMPAPPYGVFFVEEPELSIFPTTQNDLVRLFAWFVNLSSLCMTYAVTTHSPYILTAFDNLIKAGVVGRSSDEKRDAVGKLIDEKYWIAPEDFRAYKIVDGILEPIYNKETGELDADYLDSVSGQIAEEYSNLLEIQYGK